ncbi:hypothetical protein Pogu_1352 [Pyrobaculum oguniense TE7]|uniref:Aminobenzoate oxygenase n=1 Tax=Pyrobaculum oguniense (strain DSM 13380 / JCM 10595 / TE7) TaxID=698757 RepID=H6Q900_PYROT|nr:hypothetical protein Pogu_1352 [Pyrobaculum oguniense TE7]
METQKKLRIIIREPRSRHGGAPIVANPKEMEDIPPDTYPPEWDVPNAYPPYWDFSNERMYNLYMKAKKEQWDEDSLDWKSFGEYLANKTERERAAVAFWFSMLANFDNATGAFARAVIAAHEWHFDAGTVGVFTTIVMDENRHCIMCGKAAFCALKNFPFRKPQSPYEEKARKYAWWVWWNGHRYWNAIKEAFEKYPLPAVFTSFMMGEAAATTVFSGASRGAKHETMRSLFKFTAMDEARHFAFTQFLFEDNQHAFNEDIKKLVTKQIRAGFEFLSLITYKPLRTTKFWKLPRDFEKYYEEVDAIMQDVIGIPPLEFREEAWRKAVMRVGNILSRFGIEMPAIPELGIEGGKIELAEEDIELAPPVF